MRFLHFNRSSILIFFLFRVKLFYSSPDGKYNARGVGNLFLKPSADGQKTLMVVRADTSLSTLLLNISLSKQLPITKLSDKDISLFCVPNPPISGVADTKPVKFLLRVKTEEDANELY